MNKWRRKHKARYGFQLARLILARRFLSLSLLAQTVMVASAHINAIRQSDASAPSKAAAIAGEIISMHQRLATRA